MQFMVVENGCNLLVYINKSNLQCVIFNCYVLIMIICVLLSLFDYFIFDLKYMFS